MCFWLSEQTLHEDSFCLKCSLEASNVPFLLHLVMIQFCLEEWIQFIHLSPILFRNCSQGDGTGPENSGAGCTGRRCLHHGPKSLRRHVGLSAGCHGRFSAAHRRGQAGAGLPRRCRKPTEAGTGELWGEGGDTVKRSKILINKPPKFIYYLSLGLQK